MTDIVAIVPTRSRRLVIDSEDFADDPMDVDDTPINKSTPRKTEAEIATHHTKKRAREEPDDDDGDDGEDSDFEVATKKRKVETEKNGIKTTKAKTTTIKKEPKIPVKKSVKQVKKAVKKEPKKKAVQRVTKKTSVKKEKKEENEIFRWWEQDYSWRKGDKKNWKWQTLRHNGVYFTDDYQPHGVKINYNGKPVDLPEEAEMLASWFARYLDHPHMKKPQFRTNFFKEFRKVLGRKHLIKEYEKCDFRPIQKYLQEQAQLRKERSKEEKEKEKSEKAKLKEKYGWAIMDGNKEQVGNYVVEPPGLFLGRGDHPKAGMRKARIMPEDVTLNLDEDAPIPECPVPGHKWGSIVNKHDVTWMATWKNSISGEPKYVFFAANSSLKGVSDRSKYQKARGLVKKIDAIRSDYMVQLGAKDSFTAQRATALWVIDHLALRVGGDKNEDEADTVGCCSLRKEHVTLHKPDKIEFDFLGKDSMRYHNTATVIEQVFKNFKRFLQKKKGSDQVFDTLNPGQLNQYLQTLMPGLSAKVFRTYNASITMEAELRKMTGQEQKKMTVEEKRLFFNKSSVEVAILCNHQRSKPPTHDASMKRLRDQLVDLKAQCKALTRYAKKLKAGKNSPQHDHEGWPKFPASYESSKKKVSALKERIKRQEIKITEKDELKEVATSTSKINYIDPRVTVAWCGKIGLPLIKVWGKTVRDRFTWAIAEVEADDGKFEF